MLVSAISGPASAHAIILSSQPASGATIDTETAAIRLRFNSSKTQGARPWCFRSRSPPAAR